MSIPSPSVPPAASASEPGFLQRHPLLCYFVLAYGLSWLFWLPYVLSLDGLGILPVHLTQLGALPGAFLGPLLSGFLMTAATEGKPGVARLLRRLVLWRVGWQWYLVALIGIPAALFLGYIFVPGGVAALRISALPQLALLYLPLLLSEIFTSGLAEEPGWRGFALPRLQQRYGPLLGSLILGVLWGCWHLPLFLTSWANGLNILTICGFVLTATGTAIVITWVFNHTRGSLLITILLHATVDAFSTAVIVTNLFETRWMLQAESLAQLLGLGLVFPLLVIILTRGCLGYSGDSESFASKTM